MPLNQSILNSIKPLKVAVRWISKIIPDEPYIKLKYFWAFGKWPNLKNPKTFNEKVNWLKLHNRKPIYTTMVDKYEAKKYVAERIGKEHIIPTYGVWERFEDIDFSTLPNQFVLKGTHDGGSLVIVRDKSKMDMGKARAILTKSLKTNYYWHGREWPYKNVRPRILAEQYMEDDKSAELRDYKFFSFDAVKKALFTTTEKECAETKFDFFDMDFKHLNITNGHDNADVPPAKPEYFEKMKKFADILSKINPNLRVDFYEVNGLVYFGELTFSHWNAMVPLELEKWDRTFGDWIQLPDENGGGGALIGEGYALWLHQAEYVKPKSLNVYKILCFNGKPEIIQTIQNDKQEDETIDYFDTEWNLLNLRQNFPNSKVPLSRPRKFNEMLEIAKKLNTDCPLLRVDVYEIHGEIYFSEFTFFSDDGMASFEPDEWDLKLGNMITLPEYGM